MDGVVSKVMARTMSEGKNNAGGKIGSLNTKFAKVLK